MKLSGPASAAPVPVWLEDGLDVGTLVAKVPTMLLVSGSYTIETSVFSSTNGRRVASHGATVCVCVCVCACAR